MQQQSETFLRIRDFDNVQEKYDSCVSVNMVYIYFICTQLYVFVNDSILIFESNWIANKCILLPVVRRQVW